MRPRFLLTVTLFIAVLSSLAAAQDDAAKLQRTLNKIAFAHQVRILSQTVQLKPPTDEATNQRLSDEQLEFTLSDVTTGPISEIADRQLTDLISGLPDGKRLDLSPGGGTTVVEGKVLGTETQADVRWSGGDTGGPAEAQLSGYTLRQGWALDHTDVPLTVCTRYVRATVTAHFQGQVGLWKAVYLLGCPSPHPVHSIDLVMYEAVATFWDADVYPYFLLNLRAHRLLNGAARQWLQNNASTACASRTICFENDKVRIPQTDVQTLMEKLTASVQKRQTAINAPIH